MHAGGVELLSVARHVLVRMRERGAQPIKLQRADLVERSALDRLELMRRRRPRALFRRPIQGTLGPNWTN